MAVEEPVSRTVLEEDTFGIRDHPALAVAEASSPASITSFYSHSELPVQLRLIIHQLR